MNDELEIQLLLTWW